MTKAEAARYVSEHFFRVGPRSLDKWPLTRFKPGREVMYDPDELIEVARMKLAESARRTSVAA
jgi:hypothetical protein